MAAKQPVAIVFDTFGTVVDWRGSLIAELTDFGRQRSIEADWTGLVDAWRAAYHPSMDRVRKGEQPWTTLDSLHRASLDKLVAQFGISGLTEADLQHINRGWHRLKPWPDSVPGLTRLKRRYIIGPYPTATCPCSPTWRSTPAFRGTWCSAPTCSVISSPIRRPISASPDCSIWSRARSCWVRHITAIWRMRGSAG